MKLKLVSYLQSHCSGPHRVFVPLQVVVQQVYSLTIFPVLRASGTSDLLHLGLSQPRKEAARTVTPSLSLLCRQL